MTGSYLPESPFVTVVTPIYNSEDLVADAVLSVMAQTFDDWEMIIVDDASSDQSAARVATFLEMDDRLQLIRSAKNEGSSAARNTAIRHARGRFIAFLDADDFWAPQKLERQLAFMQSNGCYFSYTYYEKVNEVGEPIGEQVMPPNQVSYSDMLKSNHIGCLTAMYDTGRFGKRSMPAIRKRQDYGLWLELLRTEHYARCLPEVLAYYRVHSGSISYNKTEIIKYNYKLFREVEKFSPIKSGYYVGWNIINKLFIYMKNLKLWVWRYCGFA